LDAFYRPQDDFVIVPQKFQILKFKYNRWLAEKPLKIKLSRPENFILCLTFPCLKINKVVNSGK